MPNERDDKNKEQLIARFFDTQAKELTVKEKELSIKEKGMEGSLKLAEKSIEAQFLDNKEERCHKTKRESARMMYGIIAFGFVIVFFGFAIYFNQADIVKEFIKMFGSLGVGIFGGYFYGKEKGRTIAQNEKQNEE